MIMKTRTKTKQPVPSEALRITIRELLSVGVGFYSIALDAGVPWVTGLKRPGPRSHPAWQR